MQLQIETFSLQMFALRKRLHIESETHKVLLKGMFSWVQKGQSQFFVEGRKGQKNMWDMRNRIRVFSKHKQEILFKKMQSAWKRKIGKAQSKLEGRRSSIGMS